MYLKTGPFLGVDLSPRNCGVSISDSMGIVSTPLCNIHWHEKKKKKILHYLGNIIITKKITKVIIGIPLNIRGTLDNHHKYIKLFAHNLYQITNIPYYLHDETLSTKASTGHLTGHWKKLIDKKNEVAASYILQTWLDEQSVKS